jgi:iron complex transport system permease protein
MTADVLVVRAGGMSAQLRRRPMIVFGLLLAAVVVLFILSISAGTTWLHPGKVVDVLTGAGTRPVRFQVMELRFPRAVIGVLAGAALALSGALLQSAVRNPLASPDVLGITSGASVGAVIVYVLGWRVFGAPLSVSLPLAALAGGAIAAAIVFLISRGGPVGGLRLILVGIGVNAALQGAIYGLLVVGGTFDVMQAQVWLTGDLSADARRIAPLAVTVVVVLLAGWALSRSLTSMQLGADVARGVGVPVNRMFTGLLVCSVVAASVAVSAAGPLGFVALAAPQLARLLAGGTRAPLACSAACGALLVLAADLVSRTLLNGLVSVGLLTAIVGGPILISLLLNRVRRQV